MLKLMKLKNQRVKISFKTLKKSACNLVKLIIDDELKHH